MKGWWVIARREFAERVRTKWFVIGTLLGPIGMIALIVIPALLSRAGTETVSIQILDRTSRLAPTMSAAFAAIGWKAEVVPAETPEATLLARIGDETIDGFVTVPVDGLGAGEITYQGDNASSLLVIEIVRQVVTTTVQTARGLDAGVPAAQLGQVLAPVRVRAQHTTGEAGGRSGAAAFVVGYAVMFVLYMAILLYAMNVMRSVVQEKTSRVVELIVAATKPRALMAGKILGVGAVGLVQLTVWLGMAVITLRVRDQASIPPLGVAEVVVILAYFVLGYFFYAALYAAVGAMVSTEQEAQQAQTPVVMLLILPMVSMNLVSNDPRGGMAELMTQLPFASPILMPMRFLLGGAGPIQVGISLLILVASTAAVSALAARIYRVGILMTGKRPSLRELWRWLRY
ncbi:MAG: ABC transporter permease [Kofleriaceae bacterium]|nr:ABC transporter permease [Kofleriaceae bacterium]MBP6838662.1 ABC transporter permease [Kofleriaceae bacterium]MBP9204318.1 ABC transporter permease [Kofleriaceae bacterium]